LAADWQRSAGDRAGRRRAAPPQERPPQLSASELPLVDEVQDQLEAIYDIHCPRAARFLLHPDTANLLRIPQVEEELWIHEEDGALDIGLYLAPQLRARVGHRSLREAGWLEPSLDAYCRVAEGVSHFLYLVRTASLDRRLSLLEMEAQGEVDKFASLLLHRWPSMGGPAARALHAQLFDAVSYHSHLGPAERSRYHEANRLGRAFSARLLVHCAARRLDRLLEALRYAYRLGAEAKLQHLARAA
jgi:hypothetical protein